MITAFYNTEVENIDEEASEGIVLCNKLLSEDTVEEDDEF